MFKSHRGFALMSYVPQILCFLPNERLGTVQQVQRLRKKEIHDHYFRIPHPL